MQLLGRQIVLGITGGIAAYKAADLTRRLREAGAGVQVVMTGAAARFVTPLTFQALSGRPVRDSLWDRQAEAAMGHIELARWAQAVLVAPASADFIARLAQGRADGLLTTLCLATRAPIVLAPAMNHAMWTHPATRDNVATLQARGVRLFGPACGSQACGESGAGRMLEPAQLVEALGPLLGGGALQGLRVLVTAGPTREPIDPVRFLSNRSSGRMGFALAQAAAEAGAEVTLVSGPVALTTPPGVQRVEVETAEQMHQAVLERAGHSDIFIANAAVADYRPRHRAGHKIKKTGAALSLELVRTPDIVTEVAARRPRPFVLGFAAETRELEAHALAKLDAKGLDMIAANPVGRPGQGFDSPDNALELFWPGGRQSLPKAAKIQLARELIALLARHHAQRDPSPHARERTHRRTQDTG